MIATHTPSRPTTDSPEFKKFLNDMVIDGTTETEKFLSEWRLYELFCEEFKARETKIPNTNITLTFPDRWERKSWFPIERFTLLLLCPEVPRTCSEIEEIAFLQRWEFLSSFLSPRSCGTFQRLRIAADMLTQDRTLRQDFIDDLNIILSRLNEISSEPVTLNTVRDWLDSFSTDPGIQELKPKFQLPRYWDDENFFSDYLDSPQTYHLHRFV